MKVQELQIGDEFIDQVNEVFDWLTSDREVRVRLLSYEEDEDPIVGEVFEDGTIGMRTFIDPQFEISGPVTKPKYENT